MSSVEKAIEKLEKILERHLCFSRREELQEVISILKDEQELKEENRKQDTEKE